MTLNEFIAEWNNADDRLLVHTSGSTGAPKPMWVEKRRMEASARITCDFLGLQPGDTALLCLPLDYIAGKMMVVRSIVRNLRLISVEPSGHPLKQIRSNPHPNSSPLLPQSASGPPTGGGPQDNRSEQAVGSLPQLGEVGGGSFAAMVPMQVWNSLQVPEERQRLQQIRHLIIGGGAIDDTLARELRHFPNNIWSTYGMTETLSHIALRRLSGDEASEWYTPFPTVSISQDADGCLVIDAPEVCGHRLVTNDIVEIQPSADRSQPPRFKVLGRKDNVICSGGIKIHAEEVEHLLRPHLRVPFIITKAPDPKFGEVVALLYEADDASNEQDRTVGNEQDVADLCRQRLPKFYQPRLIRRVPQILYTETGKPRRDLSLY